MSLFGCNQKSDVLTSSNDHPLINKNNRNKYNFGELKNYHTEFLVLLNEEDMNDKSFFWFNESIKIKLLKKKYKFPGKLHIICFNDIEHEKDFIIEDMPVPNEIYIKLPDKNIYVLLSKYNVKYFYSKQNELKNIFILLGAKKITMKFENRSKIYSLINAEMKVNISNIDISEMTFYYDEEIINNINSEMFSNKNFHFLPKEYNWQEIIIRRLEKNLIKDNHTYIYTNNLSFKSTFGTKLKLMNVNFNYNTEEFNNIRVTYEIEYYKLNNCLDKLPTYKSIDEYLIDNSEQSNVEQPIVV